MRLMHPLRTTEAVRETFDVGRRTDGSPLLVDLATPRAEGPWPLALLVHGAVPDAMNVTMRTAEMYRDWACVLAASGVASVLFDHTLGWPELRLDQALAETDQVLAWLATEGPARGLDVARFTAIMVSGGAVLAPELLSGGRPLRPQRAALVSPVAGAPPPPAGLALYESAARMSLAAAAPAIAATGTRLLVLRAGGDKPEWLALLDEALRALLAEDGDLAIDNRPGASHCYELLLDDARTRAAIEQVLALARA